MSLFPRASRQKTIVLPSGDQLWKNSLTGVFVTRRVRPVRTSTRYRSLLPRPFEKYAIVRPFGDQRGHWSVAGPCVMRRALPPLLAITQMSPRSTNAAWRPSALMWTCSPPLVIVRNSRPLLRTSLLTSSFSGWGFGVFAVRSAQYSLPASSKTTRL